MADSLGTFISEADAFGRRHPDLTEAASAAGRMWWGMLRALAECPDCPGVFRRPLDPGWRTLVCPACRGIWMMRDGG